MPRRAAAIGPGCVVLVVGPSGAGKDALLAEARSRLAHDGRFLFPRRVVTRAADGSENHVSLSWAAFDEVARHGGFALHWHAHGLRYGIPAEADAAARAGRTVVFNASRQIVAAARGRYAATAVVMIDAPVEVRAARLAARNRERAEQVLSRLGRVVPGFSPEQADLVIDNSGGLDSSARHLVEWLHALPARSALADFRPR
jgi:ribose 1,5-bisphosphokinase